MCDSGAGSAADLPGHLPQQLHEPFELAGQPGMSRLEVRGGLGELGGSSWTAYACRTKWRKPRSLSRLLAVSADMMAGRASPIARVAPHKSS